MMQSLPPFLACIEETHTFIYVIFSKGWRIDAWRLHFIFNREAFYLFSLYVAESYGHGWASKSQKY